MRKLTKQELNDVFKLTYDMISLNERLRLGQAFFNALHTIHPETANSIRATDYDTFYNDKIMDKCLDYISEK